MGMFSIREINELGAPASEQLQEQQQRPVADEAGGLLANCVDLAVLANLATATPEELKELEMLKSRRRS